MRTACFALWFIGLMAADAAADHRTVRYPRVYGATGRPYGPTQANNQYERQYGRPWHGHGGSTTRNFIGGSFSIGVGYYPQAYIAPTIVNGYLFGGNTGLPGYANYGPVYSYTPMATQVNQAYPLWIGGSPFNNDALRQAQLENDLRWQTPLILGPAKSTSKPKLFPSSPDSRLKSLREQAQGDLNMKRQDYNQACKNYRDAIKAAPERAEARFRLAFSLICIGQYQASITHFRRGLELDASLPTTGTSLGKILGRDNGIAKNTILARVVQWTKEDIRDPDRLFVLGVLLHYDNRLRDSAVAFEAAYRLAGGGDHIAAFLREQKKTVGQVVAATQSGKPAVKPSAVIEIKPPVPPIEPDEQPGSTIVPPLPNP